MRYCQYKSWANRNPTDACPVNSPSIKTQDSSASPFNYIQTRKESDEHKNDSAREAHHQSILPPI